MLRSGFKFFVRQVDKGMQDCQVEVSSVKTEDKHVECVPLVIRRIDNFAAAKAEHALCIVLDGNVAVGKNDKEVGVFLFSLV